LDHHEAVGGFFGAPEGAFDDTSFEGGNKSGMLPKRLLDSQHAHARKTSIDSAAANPQFKIRNPKSGRTLLSSRQWRKRSKIPV